MVLQQAAVIWDEFMYMMDRALPGPDDTLMFPFPYDRSGVEFAG